MRSYEQVLAYMYEQLPMFHRIGAPAYKNNLDNTLALSRLTQQPEKKFKTIHIAGTNGKGSVSNILASILYESGYKTGLFTSPHLKDFRERIRIDGKMISRKDVIKFINQYKHQFDVLQPSFFEITFAMAMQHFNNHQVDVAVIETGMGGRLDSTNIISPELCIITNIGFDHMQFLGNSLKEIAGEKAGIIKNNVDVVIGETHPETWEVFTEKARKTKSRVIFADKHCKAVAEKNTGMDGLLFNIHQNGQIALKDLRCPLSASYQLQNFQTTYTAVQELISKGFKISENSIRKGFMHVLENTGFRGRWMIVSKKPLTIFETAHNEDGIRLVFDQIKNMNYRALHVVWGMVNDKNVAKILSLLPSGANYYFCKPDIPRGLDVETLLRHSAEAGLSGKACPSVKEAYQEAKKNAGNKDIILATGSIFVVAELV